MIGRIYPSTLQCGISPEQFGRMTLREAADHISAFAKAEKRRRRELAAVSYDLAVLMTYAIHSPKSFPSPEEFLEEKSSAGWEAVRDHMRSAAVYNNKKWGEGK